MKLIKFTLQLLILLTIPSTIIILTLILNSHIPNEGNSLKGIDLTLGILESILFIVFGYIADKFGKWFDSNLK